MHKKLRQAKSQTAATYRKAMKQTKVQVAKVDGMPKLPTIKKQPRIPSIV